MVRLRIDGEEVTLRGGEWSGASEELQPDLDALKVQALRTLPHGYHPDLDLKVAEFAERLLGATILDHTPPPLKKGAVA